MHKKCKIQYQWSQPYVKSDFIASTGAFQFKKRDEFYKPGSVGNVMELFGFINPNNSIPN